MLMCAPCQGLHNRAKIMEYISTHSPHGGHQGFLCLLPSLIRRQGQKQGHILHMLSSEREN